MRYMTTLLAVLISGLVLAVPAQATTPREQRAAAEYEAMWQRATPYFGAAGMPSPHITFGGNRTAMVLPERRVLLADNLVAALGSKRGGGRAVRLERRDHRRWAQATLLHEWAHVYQRDEVLSSVEAREGGAGLFAANVGRVLIPRHRSHADPAADYFTATYGPDAWQSWQFGPNWGANPRTLG